MPRLTNRPPAYRLHRASGQACVVLNGRTYYLGPYGTKTSKAEYDRLIGEWLANGRQAPGASGAFPDLTVNELAVRYMTFAQSYYQRDGVPTGEPKDIGRALKYLKPAYGHTLASEFGPLALKAVRASMLASGLCRKTINAYVGKIKRLFKWAVENELTPPAVYQGLQAVAGIRPGREGAHDHEPVKPVPREHVEAVLPYLPAPLRAAIEVQMLTGCRPSEALGMRGGDIDCSGPLWVYRPASHKGSWRDRDRVILIGPRAQSVLKPWLESAGDGYLFSPIRAEAVRNAVRRAIRRTPMTPSQAKRKPKSKRKHPLRERYDKNSLNRALTRACDKAGVKKFGPNRLRHLVATRVRQEYGLEAAQLILGHAKADVTQIYAERDIAKAVEIIKALG